MKRHYIRVDIEGKEENLPKDVEYIWGHRKDSPWTLTKVYITSVTLHDIAHNYDWYLQSEQMTDEVELYIKTELPNSGEAFHYEAEIAVGLREYAKWYRDHVSPPDVRDEKETQTIFDFALRIAKVLKESQSSTSLFFVQQAYPDSIDAPSEYNNSVEILDNIITLASLRGDKPKQL